MEKGSRHRRKAESENISLCATLQEPEFRCFTLNSQVSGAWADLKSYVHKFGQHDAHAVYGVHAEMLQGDLLMCIWCAKKLWLWVLKALDLLYPSVFLGWETISIKMESWVLDFWNRDETKIWGCWGAPVWYNSVAFRGPLKALPHLNSESLPHLKFRISHTPKIPRLSHTSKTKALPHLKFQGSPTPQNPRLFHTCNSEALTHL